MAKIEDIINQIQEIAPLTTQEEWDNSGWQIRLQKKDIKKIMLCITITEEVLAQAKSKNCDMIISHHPLFFGEYKKDNPIVIKLIANHIPVYSIHTPLDKTDEGTTDSLVKACGFEVDEVINDYTKLCYTEFSMEEVAEKIKKGLGISKLKVTNYNPDKVVRKIAFCAGSGTSFCDEVMAENCDCFVTADLKYHTALDFNGCIIDVGHLESEKPVLQYIKAKINLAEFEIAEETAPVRII